MVQNELTRKKDGEGGGGGVLTKNRRGVVRVKFVMQADLP